MRLVFLLIILSRGLWLTRFIASIVRVTTGIILILLLIFISLSLLLSLILLFVIEVPILVVIMYSLLLASLFHLLGLIWIVFALIVLIIRLLRDVLDLKVFVVVVILIFWPIVLFLWIHWGLLACPITGVRLMKAVFEVLILASLATITWVYIAFLYFLLLLQFKYFMLFGYLTHSFGQKVLQLLIFLKVFRLYRRSHQFIEEAD